MPIDPLTDVAKANDKYRAQLRSTWISSPADTSLLVTAVPENVPTYVTVGWNTDLETVFFVEGKTGDSSANYALTGVTRVKGANVNLPENTPVNCLNHEEFFNQYESKINTIISEVNDALEIVDEIAGAAYTEGDLNLVSEMGTPPNVTVDGAGPKRAMYVPASAMYPSLTQPCAPLAQVETSTNKVNVKVLDFDGSGNTKEYAEFGIQSPSYWDASTVTAQFVWYASAGSGTVNWEIQGGSFADDDALDAAYGTLQEVTDTLTATRDVMISAETSAITIAGSPTAGDWLMFRVARDPANDTNTSDARLLGVRIRFGVAKYSDA